MADWQDPFAGKYDNPPPEGFAEFRKTKAEDDDPFKDFRPDGDAQNATAFIDHLEKGAVTTKEFADLEIKEREPIFGDWCLRGDLGFIFAPRGLGKTWQTMHLAQGAATKANVGPWPVHAQTVVFYIDGEMLPWDVKSRLKLLGGAGVDNFYYLNHEILCDRTDQIINLADADVQAGILEFCKRKKIELLCLDNLSCLASGVDENNAMSWECIQSWLLALRRLGVTVIFIHHAGRNGKMRGSSKREDLASWILQLDYPVEWDENAGAQFISRFTKWRSEKQPPTYHWTYTSNGNEIDVKFKVAGPLEVFMSHVESGLETCSDIATEMNVTKGYVSRLAKDAEDQHLITIDKRKYKPVNEPF